MTDHRGTIASDLLALGRWWRRRLRTLRVANLLLAAYAAAKLGTELWRLLVDPGRLGAVDLALRHGEVAVWFAGLPFYGRLPAAVYPPASYALLWPLMGWLSFPQARWLWALLYLVTLILGVRMILRQSLAETAEERRLVALMLLALNGTGICVGSGQLSIPVTVLLLAALLEPASTARRTGLGDLRAAAPFVGALVKPTLAVPFYWMMALRPGRGRTAAWIVVGYLLVTLLAVSYRPEGLIELVAGWINNGRVTASHGSLDLYLLLFWLGESRWYVPGSLVVLSLLGVFIWRHRTADPWPLLGVTAITARLWTYHRLYDNVILLLPLLALFRGAKSLGSERPLGVAAGLTAAVGLAALLLPARAFHAWPTPWPVLFTLTHAGAWALQLVVLWLSLRTERCRGRATAAQGGRSTERRRR